MTIQPTRILPVAIHSYFEVRKPVDITNKTCNSMCGYQLSMAEGLERRILRGWGEFSPSMRTYSHRAFPSPTWQEPFAPSPLQRQPTAFGELLEEKVPIHYSKFCLWIQALCSFCALCSASKKGYLIIIGPFFPGGWPLQMTF